VIPPVTVAQFRAQTDITGTAHFSLSSSVLSVQAIDPSSGTGIFELQGFLFMDTQGDQLLIFIDPFGAYAPLVSTLQGNFSVQGKSQDRRVRAASPSASTSVTQVTMLPLLQGSTGAFTLTGLTHTSTPAIGPVVVSPYTVSLASQSFRRITMGRGPKIIQEQVPLSSLDTSIRQVVHEILAGSSGSSDLIKLTLQGFAPTVSPIYAVYDAGSTIDTWLSMLVGEIWVTWYEALGYGPSQIFNVTVVNFGLPTLPAPLPSYPGIAVWVVPEGDPEGPGALCSSGSLTGSVIDESTNGPLAGVTIQIGGPSQSGGITNSSGIYDATELTCGHYLISAYKVGYERGSGEAQITAGQKTTAHAIYLTPIAFNSITITPQGPTTISAPSGIIQFFATALDSAGHPVTPQPPFNWSSSDNAVATASSSGLFTGASPGTAIITAWAGGFTSNPVSVTVTQTLASLQISPTVPTVLVGSTTTLSVSATDVLGNSAPTPPGLVWASSDDSLATVANGIVTGIASGGPTISVSDPVSGQAAAVTITVTPFELGAYSISGYGSVTGSSCTLAQSWGPILGTYNVGPGATIQGVQTEQCQTLQTDCEVHGAACTGSCAISVNSNTEFTLLASWNAQCNSGDTFETHNNVTYTLAPPVPGLAPRTKATLANPSR
jgi:hypothetical protein